MIEHKDNMSILKWQNEALQQIKDLVEHKKGIWYGMKSKKINEEGLSTKFIEEKKDIKVPYLDAERYLVKIINH